MRHVPVRWRVPSTRLKWPKIDFFYRVSRSRFPHFHGVSGVSPTTSGRSGERWRMFEGSSGRTIDSSRRSRLESRRAAWISSVVWAPSSRPPPSAAIYAERLNEYPEPAQLRFVRLEAGLQGSAAGTFSVRSERQVVSQVETREIYGRSRLIVTPRRYRVECVVDFRRGGSPRR